MNATSHKYTVIIERDEDGWLVSEVVELPGCHTQARTMDELMARTYEAVSAYIEAEQPQFVDRFVGIQQIVI